MQKNPPFYWHIGHSLWQESKATQVFFWAEPLTLCQGWFPDIPIDVGEEVPAACLRASPKQGLLSAWGRDSLLQEAVFEAIEQQSFSGAWVLLKASEVTRNVK